jgi:hypothetical protein
LRYVLAEAPPHPDGSKPARTYQAANKVLGRAEFVALPIPAEKRLEFAELRQGLAGVDQLGR